MTLILIFFTLLSLGEVGTLLRSIKFQFFGIDNVSVKLLTLYCPYLLPTITYVINSCQLGNTFPYFWRRSIVTRLAKLCTPSDYGVYRFFLFYLKYWNRWSVDEGNFDLQSGFRSDHIFFVVLVTIVILLWFCWTISKHSTLLIAIFSFLYSTTLALIAIKSGSFLPIYQERTQ